MKATTRSAISPRTLGSALVVSWAIAACSHHGTAAKPAPAAGTHADSLIVSVEEVRRIANHEGLTAHSHADLRHPPPGDLTAPGPCRAAGISDLTFGAGWSEFRSAGYHGITDDLKPGGPAMIQTVSQAVAIYPDATTARGALGQLESALQACTALHDINYDFTIDRPDAGTVRITDEGWSHLYRAKSSVLISVGVLGIEPADRIAGTIMQTATDRVR